MKKWELTESEIKQIELIIRLTPFKKLKRLPAHISLQINKAVLLITPPEWPTLVFPTKYRHGKKPRKKKLSLINTEEWKLFRKEVLIIYGSACMKCGCTKGPPHVDHIKPKSIFPELTFSVNNLQVLCKSCNFKKGSVEIYDYRPRELQALFPLNQ